MNAYLNYLLEASIGLCLFLLVYQLLLQKETNFRLNRIFLLIAIIASVTFPLFKLNTLASPVPSLNFSVPEIENLTSIPSESTPEETQPTINTWKIVANLYVAGLLIFLTLFIIRLTKIVKALKRSPKYKYSNHNIVELKGDQSPFSFFNYIFIGSSSPITENEKKQILEHEAIHARLYHSIDILLLNALGIVFWFNPIVRFYKKIFVQLHEFEADARAVEKHDVNAYCNLLAKVALSSVDFRLANHFSNSLTIKRIEMMRTLKQKIKSWKIIAVSTIVAVFFFVVSCQDQVENIQSTEILEKKIEYPVNVQQTLNKLKTEFPKDEFIVISPSGHNPEDFKGHENHISVINGDYVYEANAITVVKMDEKDATGNASKYLILQYKAADNLHTDGQSKAGEIVEEVPKGEKVYLTVEQPPSYPGGLDKMREVISQNIRYPEKARSAGIEGTVYVGFIVEKDGKVSEAAIIKGISKECDEEALRAVQKFDSWNPGMQSGKPVRVKFVYPVKFRL